MSKQRTYEQVLTAQRRAVSAATNLREDDELADELDALTPEEYAERKGIEIVENPPRRAINRRKTTMTVREYRTKLIEKDALITELQEENDELHDTLAEIKGLVASDDEDEDGEIVDAEDDEDSDDEDEGE